jgi:hypothetical protein
LTRAISPNRLDLMLQPKLFPSPGRSATETQFAIASLQQMHAYAVQRLSCRAVFLLHYFGENLSIPCNNCDVCAAGAKSQVWHDVTDEVVQTLVMASRGAEQLRAWGLSMCKRQKAVVAPKFSSQVRSVSTSGPTTAAGATSGPTTAAGATSGPTTAAGAVETPTHLFWRGGCLPAHVIQAPLTFRRIFAQSCFSWLLDAPPTLLIPVAA